MGLVNADNECLLPFMRGQVQSNWIKQTTKQKDSWTRTAN